MAWNNCKMYDKGWYNNDIELLVHKYIQILLCI